LIHTASSSAVGALAFEMGDADGFELGEVLQRGGVLEATGERGAHEVRARPREVTHIEAGGFGTHGGQQGVELPGGVAPAAAVDDERVDAGVEALLEVLGEIGLPPDDERQIGIEVGEDDVLHLRGVTALQHES
jgi:hypothetical protein